MAKELEGRLQMASGAIEGAKGDVETEYYLVECKRTDKDSLILKKSWVDKIDEEAMRIGKEFAIHLQIRDRNLVLISEEEFGGLIDALDALIQIEREGYKVVKEVVDGV